MRSRGIRISSKTGCSRTTASSDSSVILPRITSPSERTISSVTCSGLDGEASRLIVAGSYPFATRTRWVTCLGVSQLPSPDVSVPGSTTVAFVVSGSLSTVSVPAAASRLNTKRIVKSDPSVLN